MPNHRGLNDSEVKPMTRIVVNDIDITDLKYHPRILELRFVLIYDVWFSEYSARASEVLEYVGLLTRCDLARLRQISNQYFNIRRLAKTDRTRFAREVILMGLVWGESRYAAAKKFLNFKPETAYNERYNPANWLTTEFIEALDEEVQVCGVAGYANELKRFLTELEQFLQLLNK